MKIVLFETQAWKELLPLTYTRFLHDITIGIYSNDERVKLNYNNMEYIIPRLNETPYHHLTFIFNNQLFNINNTEEIILWNSSFIFDDNIVQELSTYQAVFSEGNIWIAIKISRLDNNIIQELYNENYTTNTNFIFTFCDSIRTYEDLVTGVQKTIEKDLDTYIAHHPQLIEIQPNVFIHPSVNIRMPTDLDTTQGKIVIEENTKITAFTLIEGSVFIDKECLITRAFIRPKTSILKYCRIAGELSLSTINTYSNKAHDGCIALSYIGSWVNFGAGTECATLKYTYTPLSFKTPNNKIKTSMLGCGSIICDWASTGVGTILPPACIVGVGATLHIPYKTVDKYTYPFSWGNNNTNWCIQKWIEMAQIKMKRRQKSLDINYINFYQELYQIAQIDRSKYL